MTKKRGDLLHGTLEMLILRSLADGPMHGYGITERLQDVADELRRLAMKLRLCDHAGELLLQAALHQFEN